MSEEIKEEDEHTERVNHYRNLIEGNMRMTKHHIRIYDHWYPRIGAPMAYEMARVAFNNNGRYQLLKGRHSIQ